MQQRIRDVIRERTGIEVPSSGSEIRIIRKTNIGGQVQAVYRATCEEGFFYTNPGRNQLTFEAWENIVRFDRDHA